VCSLFALSFAPAALAGEEQELEAAKTRMTSGKYDEAEARLRRMVGYEPGVEVCPQTPETTEHGCRLTDPELLQKARGYLANALFANGKKDEARKPIYDILIQDPSFIPSTTLFPDEVIDLFNDERGKHAAELAKKIQEEAAKVAKERADQDQQKKERNAYIAALEARASVEVEKRSRWIAMIPFGAGQYQNDNIGWGLFFTMSQVLTAGTSIVTTGVSYNLSLQGIAQQNWDGCLPAAPPVNKVCKAVEQISPATTTELQALQVVNDVSLGAFIALAVTGVIEAQVDFKPIVETKHPELLPPKPKVLLTGVPNAPSSIGAGLKVTF
jgi:tetratricopeptide (TPR) repeat protein